MTELTDEKATHQRQASIAGNPMQVVQVGLDDGYAYTKVALPDGRLVSVPSRARMGAAGVTWIRDEEQRIFEYETAGTVYSVGAVDGEPTQFDEYPGSALNRVIVQHALQAGGFIGPISPYGDRIASRSVLPWRWSATATGDSNQTRWSAS